MTSLSGVLKHHTVLFISLFFYATHLGLLGLFCSSPFKFSLFCIQGHQIEHREKQVFQAPELHSHFEWYLCLTELAREKQKQHQQHHHHHHQQQQQEKQQQSRLEKLYSARRRYHGTARVTTARYRGISGISGSNITAVRNTRLVCCLFCFHTYQAGTHTAGPGCI